ncbi:MAG TPA: hypothetical protein VFC24_10115 [Casimicrobiaceae bacterium]|nr:hypothetical protein [Casimicrobiaceae bacterium]
MSTRLILSAPLWSRLATTAFIVLLVPYYWTHEGWRNFFWLSDVSLFVTVFALWLRSPLLNSMMAVGVLPFEIYWNLTFFTRLFTGIEIGEIPDYMFDANLPLLLRVISLFHVLLPVIWILLLLRWGYDRRALRLQTFALWIVVWLTYAFTAPDLNINWVYLPYKLRLSWLPEDAWLLAYVVLVPLLVYWPLDRLYSRAFAPAR